MSGLLRRNISPLALMKSDDRDPYQANELRAHDFWRGVPSLRWRPCHSSRFNALTKLEFAGLVFSLSPFASWLCEVVAGQSRPSVLWRRERSMAIPLSRPKPPKAGAEGQSLQGDGHRQQFLRQDREHAPSTPSSIRTALGSHMTAPHSSWRGARLLLSWPNGVFRLLRTSPRGSIRRFSSSPRWSAPACWPAPP